MPSDTAPGALALVGSGEYTNAMNDADAYLLETLGGPAGARVVLLPTASGLEAGAPARWNELGRGHFASLGVSQIRATLILHRADASDAEQLDLLRGGTFFYFSGGSPGQITETLRGTPAWDIIREAHARGAVLAGCSAGAMALGGQTISLRRVMASASSPAADAQPAFVDALGVAPHLITFPHFDRMAGFVGQQAFADL
ncbi:MAG: Type 1 glutamine amidotransferase-like domain-containing protein, partial [Ktedonobacterales bacterium]